MTQVNGKVPYKTSSVVLLSEIVKFSISLTLYTIMEYRRKKISIFSESILNLPKIIYLGIKEDFQLPPDEKASHLLKVCLPYSVPALFYAFNNNLSMVILEEMDPATYQLLANLKIMTTAILFRIFIKKKLTPLQWLALLILASAGIVDGVNELNKTHKIIKNTTDIHLTYFGAFLMLIYCTISGCSGVYTEIIMKKRISMNTHLQNLLLYTYGIIVNFAAYLVTIYTRNESFDLLKNFTGLTYLLVFIYSVAGVLIGFILKYSSNILRLFVISSSMVMTTGLLLLFFSIQINFLFILSLSLVVLSIFLYYHDNNKK